MNEGLSQLWSKIDRRGPDECWEWTGARSNGYPSFHLHGRAVKVRRELCARGKLLGNVKSICNNKICCNPAHLRLADAMWRLWSHVSINRLSGCWEWTGTTNGYGYGRIKHEGRRRQAHKLSWELERGPVPDGLFVCHHCDNRKCVNPAHLFLGTPMDNSRDMVRKGRALHGVRNHNAKLTNRQVVEIKCFRGVVKQRSLGRVYGVSHAAVGYIQRDLTYQSPPITDPQPHSGEE